jgi:hypothetical protein
MVFKDKDRIFRITYTVFEVVMFHESEPHYYNSLAGWENRIRQKVPDAMTLDTLAVFKQLSHDGLIKLTKAGVRYTGDESENYEREFFYQGPDIRIEPTSKGIIYWHQVKKMNEPTESELEHHVLSLLKTVYDEGVARRTFQVASSAKTYFEMSTFKDMPEGFQRFIETLDSLAEKGYIEQNTLRGNPHERAIKITTKGIKRLREGESAVRPQFSATTINNNIFAPVHNLAQTTGDGSHIHISSWNESSRAEVLKLTESLIDALDANSEAWLEAQQLKFELRKERPNTDRIESFLNSIKSLAGTITAIAPILTSIMRVLTATPS